MGDLLEYALFMALRGIARRLSFRGADRLGTLLGRSVLVLTRYRRGVTMDNLRRAFPDRPEAELRRIALGAYENYGRSMVLMFWSSAQTPETIASLTRFDDEALVRSCLAERKGFIYLSGHVGAWEILAQSFAITFAPLTIVVQSQRNKRVDAVLNADRCRFGSTTVVMSAAAREVLSILRQGKAAGMLGDQSGPIQAAWVEFFGRPCPTHRGPALFTLKTGCALVMFFPIRQADGTYRVKSERVNLDGISGSGPSAVDELTRRHTAILERYIRMCPDHWLWMHRRWKHEALHTASHAAEAKVSGEETG